MKKLRLLIIVSIISFIAFLFFYLRPRTYTLEYEVDTFKVVERYYKKNKYYYFEISDDKHTYDFIKEVKYTTSRRLIKEIKELSEEEYNCIIPKIPDTNIYPLCYQGNELVSFHLVNAELYKEGNTKNNIDVDYKGINISSFNSATFLVWNYKGFYYINEETKKNISLFKKDTYDIPLATMINNYLFIPNYDSTHSFKEAYVINLDNGEKEFWTLDNEINYNSYILGTFDQSIYLFDKKAKKEYELVPHKKKMRVVSKKGEGTIYQGKWEKISVNKLSGGDYKFEILSLYNYEIKKGKLYMSNEGSNRYTQVSELEGVEIISVVDDTVYYYKDAKVYSFNPYIGETLLMEYFEWNFNHENMIFVYDNQK